MDDNPKRLYQKEAADYLGRPARTLEHWRFIGVGPRSYVLTEGRRERVVYDVADLDAFKALESEPREVRGDVSASG